MASSLAQALETAGLQEYVGTFRDADVDVEVFLFLTDNDLVELGIAASPRRKLLNLQKQLREMQGIQFDEEDLGEKGTDEESSESDESDEEITEEDNGPPVIFKKPVDEGHEKAKEAKKEQRRSMAAMAAVALSPSPAALASQQQQQQASTATPSASNSSSASATAGGSSGSINSTTLASQPSLRAAPVTALPASIPLATASTVPASTASSSTPAHAEYIKNKNKSSKMIKLETVPEINADEIEGADCQGWLWKEGGIVKSWKKRWCVLKGPCLYYFPTPSKTRAKGMITLPSYQITTAAEQVKKEFAFQAYHPSARTYIFVANNKHDMQHWIKMMTLATQLTAPLSAQAPGAVPVTSGSVIIPNVAPAPASASTVKPSNTPLPANAHVKFNIFDVRITRKTSEIIGLDIKVNRQNGTIVTKVHEESPAANTGMIQIGDQIVKIDGRSIAGMTAAMVVEIMRELKENFVFSIRRL